MVYTAAKPDLVPSREELRARIPGWGADLDPADRPAVPKERRDLESGAHWDFPERQPEMVLRERSIEHRFLTPVFGTSCPTRWVSGRVRRYAYARFSEGRAAHWLLLVAADRVDVLESRIAAVLAGHPDNLLAETGIRAELSHHGLRSRRGRVDTRHQALDPLVVAAPWLLAGVAVVLGARALARRRTAAALPHEPA